MSQTNNSIAETPGERFVQARENLFQMIEEGRSFSGHERNCCFLNTRDGRFANISSISGLDFPDDGRALVVTDWDQDGDLDIWTSNRNAPRLRFLRNDAAQDNHFLSLRLEGNGTNTARDAIGARVVLTVDDSGGENQRQVKALRAGEGFLAQSTKWLVFGLGDAERVERVRVHWPGGEPEEFSFADLPVNERYLLKQGSGKAQPLPAADRELRLDKRPVELPPPVSSYRIALAQRVPMPQRVVYERFDRGSETVPFDRTTFVTLFASWCAPCLEELKEFSERAEEIREAGLDVVALSVDRLAAGDQPPGDAEATLRHLRFPFRAGWADQSFVTTMQGYHNFFVPLTRPLPVPTSFLADKRGRLLAIYKGRVSLDQVLADSRDLAVSNTAPTERLALLPGRAIDHPRIEQVRRDDALRTRFFLAEVLLDVQRLPDAVVHLGEVVRMHPDCIPAWKHLGTTYETLGDLVRARRAYEKLIELDDTKAWAHFNLANLLKRRQQMDEAIAGYRRALELDPRYVEARVNLGVALAGQNRLQEALREFERAAADRPDFEPAAANLERLRQLMGESSP